MTPSPPLLWRGRVIGWGNLAWHAGRLQTDLGYVSGRAPRGRDFANALDDELDRIGQFLSRDRAAVALVAHHPEERRDATRAGAAHFLHDLVE